MYRTALDNLATVVDQVCCESIRVVMHELLEAEEIEKTSAKAQVGRDAEYHQT